MTLSDYFEGEKLLKKYGINSIRSWYVDSAEEAISKANGNSIVMKVITEKALHKSKSGLVELDLKTDKERLAGLPLLLRMRRTYCLTAGLRWRAPLSIL